ncbi:hypothetical protein PENSPDRAFT_370860 [Peniophora sp. CONT]|nr:hypothetical protein PENSPDRAFT_370860 [Peniophora sp. CONT]
MMATGARQASVLWTTATSSNAQPWTFCELASFVILYYDFCLTLSQEVAHIWSGPFSRPALLFFLNRYPMLLGNVVFIIFDIAGMRVTPEGCVSFNIAHQVLLVFAQMFVSVLLALRIDAIYAHAKPVRILLLCLGAVLAAIACWACFSQKIGRPPVRGTLDSHHCFDNDTILANRVAMAWGAQAVFDVVVFALTVWHSLQRRRRGFRNNLLTHVYQGGAMYFGAITFANTLNMVSLMYKPWEMYVRGTLTNVASSICVTMMSRLILHLYEVAPVPTSTLNEPNVLSIGSLFATELTQRAEGIDEAWNEEDHTAVGHARESAGMGSPEEVVSAMELNQRTSTGRRTPEYVMQNR